jgi:hypothetical protein
MNYQKPLAPISDNLLALKDHRVWWLAFFALIGLAIFLCFDSQAFPSASLDLKLPRRQITELTREWAKELKYEKDHIINSTEFSPNNTSKTFLEYELGGAQANELMKDKLPVWSWHTRFCRQYDFEEFETWISPAGKLNGFVHKLQNDKAMPSLQKDEAQALSRTFIEGRAQIPLKEYKIVKSWSYTQLHRVDHSFTWEDQSQEYKGARLRIQTTVSGNLLTQFSYFLYIPEAWERKFNTIRSYNNLYETIASTFYYLLQFGAVFVFLWAVSSNRLRWRFAIAMAALVTLIGAFDSFNDIASVIGDYDPTKPYSSYLRTFVIQTLAGMLPQFLSSLTLIGAAEAIYRLAYPKNIAFENFFTKKGLRSRGVLNFLVVAHLLLAIDLGWVVLYYLVGEHIHFWCPLGIDSYQILSSVFPFFSAIAVGVSASVAEELMYRVLALSLVQKITRNFWFANFFQAAAWGFMHSTYPQQPAYARGVELTLGGMLDGWILRRYGILPTMVSHYLFDAILDVKPLLNSSELPLKLSAIVPMVPFIALAGFILWNISRHGPVSDEELANDRIAHETAVTELAEPEPAVIHLIPHERALSINQRFLLVILAIACVSLAMHFRKYEALGEREHVAISAQQALQKANEVLLAHKYQLNKLRHVEWLEEESGGLDLQYIYEQVKLKRTLELSDIAKQGYMWKVRYFRQLDPEEYTVVIDKYGKELAFAVERAEDASGARLPEEEAKSKADAYLKKEHALYAPFEFASATVEKLKNRTDYSFSFKVPKLKIGDAEFKLYTSVVGDQVSGFAGSWEIPETWKHEREKRTMRDEIFGHVRTVLYLVMFIVILHWGLSVLRSGALNWRLACMVAIPFVFLAMLDDLNDLPIFFASYDTTNPIISFIISRVNVDFQNAFIAYAYSVISVAFALASLKILAPTFSLARFLRVVFLPKDLEERNERRRIWVDSLIIAVAYIAVHMFITTSASWLKALVSPNVPQDYLASICSLANVYSPTVDLLRDTFSGGFNQLTMVAVFTALYKKYCRNFWYFLGFALVLRMVMLSSERYWQDYTIDVTSSLLCLILAWFVIKKLAGYNPLVYFLVGAGELVLSRLLSLIDHGQPLFFHEAIITAILFLSPFVYVCYLFISSPPGREPDTHSAALVEGQGV